MQLPSDLRSSMVTLNVFFSFPTNILSTLLHFPHSHSLNWPKHLRMALKPYALHLHQSSLYKICAQKCNISLSNNNNCYCHHWLQMSGHICFSMQMYVYYYCSKTVKNTIMHIFDGALGALLCLVCCDQGLIAHVCCCYSNNSGSLSLVSMSFGSQTQWISTGYTECTCLFFSLHWNYILWILESSLPRSDTGESMTSLKYQTVL